MKKADLKSLRILASKLPPATYPARVRRLIPAGKLPLHLAVNLPEVKSAGISPLAGESVSQFLQRAGVSEKELIPVKVTETHRVNHFRRLKRAFAKGGLVAVKQYIVKQTK